MLAVSQPHWVCHHSWCVHFPCLHCRNAAFINSCQVPPCKSVKQHLPEPISHEGRGSSHHVPSSSDHEASNSGLHPFSRLRDLHFCLIISQARILEQVAIPFFRGSARPRDQTHLGFLAWQADPSRRGLTPRGSLECNPEIPAFPGEEN